MCAHVQVFLRAAAVVASGKLGQCLKLDLVADMPMNTANKSVLVLKLLTVDSVHVKCAPTSTRPPAPSLYAAACMPSQVCVADQPPTLTTEASSTIGHSTSAPPPSSNAAVW